MGILEIKNIATKIKNSMYFLCYFIYFTAGLTQQRKDYLTGIQISRTPRLKHRCQGMCSFPPGLKKKSGTTATKFSIVCHS